MSELKLFLQPQIRALMQMLFYGYSEVYSRNSVFMGHNSIDLKSGKYAGYFVFSVYIYITKNMLKIIFKTLLLDVPKCSILGQIFFLVKSKSHT